MAENEITKLVKTYQKFWVDLDSLRSDVGLIFIDEYKWENFDEMTLTSDAYQRSYFSGTKIAFVIADADQNTETPCLQLVLCALQDRKKDIDKDWLKKNGWKGFAHKEIPDKEKTTKRTTACFELFITSKGDYISVKIDLRSIDSADKVNTDVKALLDAMINGTYNKYEPKSSKLVFVSND